MALRGMQWRASQIAHNCGLCVTQQMQGMETSLAPVFQNESSYYYCCGEKQHQVSHVPTAVDSLMLLNENYVILLTAAAEQTAHISAFTAKCSSVYMVNKHLGSFCSLLGVFLVRNYI